MKRKRVLLVGIIFVVLMTGLVVRADDATPEPGTPQENECNPGGLLYREENQDGCPNEWYWKAGWYLAAVNNGRISRDDVPDEFKSVLPPLPDASDSNDPQDIPELPIGFCWTNSRYSFSWIYLGPPNTLRNARGFPVANCTETSGVIPDRVAFVYAHNQSEAEAICSSLGELDLVELFPIMDIPMPPNVYYCTIIQGTAR